MSNSDKGIHSALVEYRKLYPPIPPSSSSPVTVEVLKVLIRNGGCKYSEEEREVEGRSGKKIVERKGQKLGNK